MGTYYLIILVLFMACLVTHFTTYERKELLFTFFAFIILTYFSMNRFKIGYDYGPYATMYHKYAIMFIEQLYTHTHEKGYAVLNHMLGFFTMNYKLLFSVTSVFCVGGVCWYLYKKSSMVWISIFLFFVLGFYYMSYNFIRQFMAAVIMLGAFRYVQKKDFLRYLLFVFLAGSFHLSAFIMIPFYVLLQIPLKKRVLVLYVLFAIVFFMYSEPIFSVITDYVYKSYDPLTNKEMTKGIPIQYVLPFILVFIGAYPLRKELYVQNPENKFYLNALFFILVFEFIALKHGLISRFILLFMIPAMCVLIPNVLIVYKQKFFEDEKKHRVGYLLVILLFVLSIANHQYLMLDNYNGVVPYQTYADMEGGKEY